MISPDQAPPRSDLPFLRRRARPKAPAATSPPAAPAATSALADFISGRSPRPPKAQDGPPPAPAPPVSTSLDLGPTPLAQQPAAAPPSSDLDLGTAALGTAELGAAAAPSAPPAATQAPIAPERREYGARIRAGAPLILTPKQPTVMLTRLQSGIGALTFDAFFSERVGDLRLGCAYELGSGESSITYQGSPSRFAPHKANRAVVIDNRERVSVNLRKSRELKRLIIFGFSESRSQLNWGGTLVVTTFGGAKTELPLDRPASSGVMVFLSLYNVRGEFVIRAEMEPVHGPVRVACRAYGFDRITWLDDRNPVD